MSSLDRDLDRLEGAIEDLDYNRCLRVIADLRRFAKGMEDAEKTVDRENDRPIMEPTRPGMTPAPAKGTAMDAAQTTIIEKAHAFLDSIADTNAGIFFSNLLADLGDGIKNHPGAEIAGVAFTSLMRVPTDEPIPDYASMTGFHGHPIDIGTTMQLMTDNYNNKVRDEYETRKMHRVLGTVLQDLEGSLKHEAEETEKTEAPKDEAGEPEASAQAQSE